MRACKIDGNLMTVYERFEQGIALILTGLIAVVIVMATLELSKRNP